MLFSIKMPFVAVSGLKVLFTDFTLPLTWIKAYIHTHAYTLILLSIVPTLQFTVAMIYLRGWWIRCIGVENSRCLSAIKQLGVSFTGKLCSRSCFRDGKSVTSKIFKLAEFRISCACAVNEIHASRGEDQNSRSALHRVLIAR